MPQSVWPLWLVGILGGGYLLIRGIWLVVIGRKLWGVLQITGTVIFFGAMIIWMLYRSPWAQYAVLAAILLILVPLFLYPRAVLTRESKQKSNQPTPPEEK